LTVIGPIRAADRLGDTRCCGYCAVFKDREEAYARLSSTANRAGHARRAPVSQNSTACGRPGAEPATAIQIRSTF